MLLSSNGNKTTTQLSKNWDFRPSFFLTLSHSGYYNIRSVLFMRSKKATLQPTNIGTKSVTHLPNTRNGAHLKGIKLECLRLTRFLQVISRNTLSPCCHQSTQFYLSLRPRIPSRPLHGIGPGGLSHLFAGFGPNYLPCSSGFKVKRAHITRKGCVSRSGLCQSLFFYFFT